MCPSHEIDVSNPSFDSIIYEKTKLCLLPPTQTSVSCVCRNHTVNTLFTLPQLVLSLWSTLAKLEQATRYWSLMACHSIWTMHLASSRVCNSLLLRMSTSNTSCSSPFMRQLILSGQLMPKSLHEATYKWELLHEADLICTWEIVPINSSLCSHLSPLGRYIYLWWAQVQPTSCQREAHIHWNCL